MAMILDGTNGAFLPTWTTATRPASPANGEIGYNSTTGQLDQYVGGAWSSVPTGSGSGTVNSGTANQIAYYASTGTAVSGASALTFSGSGVLNVSTVAGSISKSGAATSLTLATGDTYSLSTSLGVLGLDSGATALSIRMNNGGYYLPFSFAKTGAMSVGGATATTSGSGITFPATQDASSDANTLDDYEEGTWSPTLSEEGGSASFGYTFQLARYVKTGSQVSVFGTIVLSSVSSAGGNPLKLGSLPFTPSNNSTNLTASIQIGTVGGTWTTLAPTGGYLREAQTSAYLTSITGTTQTIIQANYTSGSSNFGFSFIYSTGLS